MKSCLEFLRLRLGGLLVVTALLPGAGVAAAGFEIEIVSRDLAYPWGLAFLPGGDMLVTERGGSLRRVATDGTLSRPLGGTPQVAAHGQGGLLDVALHPEFAQNRLVYLSYAARGEDGIGTVVSRYRLEDAQLVDGETIFRALPRRRGGRHFGSRLLFLPDGSLLITLGDRGHRPNGQRLGTHPGSIIRVNADGSVPADNPYAGLDGVMPEIWTFGNRNVQGIARDPESGIVWATEHGPQGGCELNRIEPGTNYGWAAITYGRNYGLGTRIGEGEQREDVADPVVQWTPSIAPSGLAVYRGHAFPEWAGNLFAGSLKFSYLARLVPDGDGGFREERLLERELGRIRDVRVGPDGFIYLLTDARDGVIARLRPAR